MAIDMSKADMTTYVEGLNDEEIMALAGVGSALKVFGTVLEAEFEKRNGVLLDAESRKENDGKPSHVANPVIDIDIPGVSSFMLRPTSSNNKARGNGWAKDVGLSDKVKTGNVPPTLLASILVDKIATMLGGNIKDKALLDIQEALAACMTITDGKFKFDKKKAPPLNHPVEVAEWLDKLSMNFIGTTAGANHVSMEVIPIPMETHSPVEAPVGETDEPDLSLASHPVNDHHVAEATNDPEEESPDSPSGTSFMDAQVNMLLFGGYGGGE